MPDIVSRWHMGVNLPGHEKGKLPLELLRTAVQQLIDLMSQKNGWERLLAEYDECSLIDFLDDSGLSEAAITMVGLLPFILLRHIEITDLDNAKWYTIRNVYYGRASHSITVPPSGR